jgi:hypothetical protein
MRLRLHKAISPFTQDIAARRVFVGELKLVSGLIREICGAGSNADRMVTPYICQRCDLIACFVEYRKCSKFKEEIPPICFAC